MATSTYQQLLNLPMKVNIADKTEHEELYLKYFVKNLPVLPGRVSGACVTIDDCHR
jgi:hypothetical protein